MNYVLPSFQSLLFKKTEKSSMSYGLFRPQFFNDDFKKLTYLTS